MGGSASCARARVYVDVAVLQSKADSSHSRRSACLRSMPFGWTRLSSCDSCPTNHWRQRAPRAMHALSTHILHTNATLVLYDSRMPYDPKRTLDLPSRCQRGPGSRVINPNLVSA